MSKKQHDLELIAKTKKKFEKLSTEELLHKYRTLTLLQEARQAIQQILKERGISY